MSDERCKLEFRFTYDEIKRICIAMDFPEHISFKITGELGRKLILEREFAMAIVLYRISYPRRLKGMDEYFGMCRSNISKVFNAMSDQIYNKCKYGIEFDVNQFTRENLETFSKTIYNKGAIFPNVFGFVDGTMQQICRPVNPLVQTALYNGWKHMHCLKYQAITTPNCLTSSLLGPFVGSKHDSCIFTETCTEKKLEMYLGNMEEGNYAIYGDPAYTLSRYVYKPYGDGEDGSFEKEVDNSMKKVRIGVEMEFGKVAQYFVTGKTKYSNKVALNSPARTYILCTLFKNIHTCLNGSATTRYFGLRPPPLEVYIPGLMRHRLPVDDLVE